MEEITIIIDTIPSVSECNKCIKNARNLYKRGYISKREMLKQVFALEYRREVLKEEICTE